jgi:hypothetical protein
MVYKILADLVILLHFCWILFILFGFILALKRWKIAILHLVGLIYALVLNIKGWYCPLTYLENYLRSLHDTKTSYAGAFIIRQVDRFIYPDLPEKVLRIGAIALVCLYILGYTYLAKKHNILKWFKKNEHEKSPNQRSGLF